MRYFEEITVIDESGAEVRKYWREVDKSRYIVLDPTVEWAVRKFKVTEAEAKAAGLTTGNS